MSSRWFWWTGIGLASALVLYLPSMFAVAFVLTKVFNVKEPPAFFHIVYAPIIWAADHWEWFHQVMQAIARALGIK